MKPGSASTADAPVVRQLLLERHGVADLGGLQRLDAGDDEADLAGRQLVACDRIGREHAELLDAVDRIAGHHADPLALRQRTVDDPHQHHDADVVVEPRVDDHRAQRRVEDAARRRHAMHDGLEDLVDPFAGLGAAGNRVIGIDADHVLDLGTRARRIGLRKIHLVEDRNDLDTEVERGVAIGNRLRLDTLAGVDDEERTLAGRQRAADLVREVDVARRVDEVQVVGAAVTRLVFERRGLRLDRDAALSLDVHRVEHLLFHLAIAQSAATLDQSIGECRLAVVDVGNDREIADVIHAEGSRLLSASNALQRKHRCVRVIVSMQTAGLAMTRTIRASRRPA